MNAIFRGDSPLYFNLTSIVLTEGETKPFTLELRKQPSADVVITLASSNTSQLTIDPPSLSFTPSNFATPQTIRVMGVQDCLSDGTQSVSVGTVSITSADSTYNKIENVNIPVTVKDSTDNLPNIVFFQNSDLITSELGTVAFFKVNISCPIAPSTNITVPLIVDKPGEVSIDKTSLVFSDTNYSTYQTVTVTGLSDCTLDADQPFTIKSGDVTSSNPAETRFARYTTTGTRAVVYGTNLNVAVSSDTNVSLAPGSLDMTLNFTNGHPDPFISFSVSLTCPIVNPVYFSFSATDVTNVANFAIASSATSTNSFALVANTSLGNKYLAFNSTNWQTPQNVLFQLDSTVATKAYFLGATVYPIATHGPIFSDNTIHKIKMYQSDGTTANTAIAAPTFNSKTLNAKITVNSW
ncbi:MAG: hypothetical protein OEV78_09225 [Spirochaetia bacterium]|nr:hypothetical protein [Spirochaetia bacterium]